MEAKTPQAQAEEPRTPPTEAGTQRFWQCAHSLFTAHASGDGTERALRLGKPYCKSTVKAVPTSPATFLQKSTASPQPHKSRARVREPRAPRGIRGGGRRPGARRSRGLRPPPLQQPDLRLREGSAAPHRSGDPTCRGTGRAEGRGRSPGAPEPGYKKLELQAAPVHCSSRGCPQEGRHKFEWGGNLDFFF